MKRTAISLLAGAALLFAACSSEVEELTPRDDDGRIQHTAVLRFEGDIQHFDAPATRATTADWDDGATIYIQYQTASGLVDGTAVYSQSKDEWTVNYYGTITKGQQSKCEVYYFEKPASTAMTSVSLNAQSAVFADNQATYLYEDGTVTLRAHFKPQTGRIRFRGTAGCQFSITGLKWYSVYNIDNNTLSQQIGSLTLTVGGDGYTLYVYGAFEDDVNRQITIDSNDSTYLFTKQFSPLALATAKSGYINVPTVEYRNGWQLIEKDPLRLCPNNNHPHQIDMGTGIKFACCNIGSTSPIDYGEYFAWGETKPKSSYDWSTYSLCKGSSYTMTKYCTAKTYGTVDNKTQLELSNDAARANWGSPWRMPTRFEFEALYKCTWTQTAINNVAGYKVTATNGNTIFLPFAGRRSDTTSELKGSSGYYWTTELSSQYDFNAIVFEHQNEIDQVPRCWGHTVRPVSE